MTSPRQPFTLMPDRAVQLPSHGQPEDVCVWAEDGHLLEDNVCFNGKDICVECCAKAGGCCWDPAVDGERPDA